MKFQEDIRKIRTKVTLPTTPAGSNTEVQFNNSGSFGADSKLTWDITNKSLEVGDFGTPLFGNPAMFISGDTNAISGIQMRNKNTGISADCRFLISNSAKDHYLSFSVASDANTLTRFGLPLSTTDFIFNHTSGAGTDRDLAIGSERNVDMYLCTKAFIRMKLTAGGDIEIPAEEAGDGNVTMDAGSLYLTNDAGTGGDIIAEGNTLSLGKYTINAHNEFLMIAPSQYDSAIKFRELNDTYGFTIIYDAQGSNNLEFWGHSASGTGVRLVSIERVTGNVGIGTDSPSCKLQVVGAITSATATITASADNTNVAGINTLFINITGDIILGGLTGGVNGQVLHIVILGNFVNHVTLEHAEGVSSQDFINHLSVDENMSHGGAIYVCNGSDWYDTSHARHV